MDKSKLIEQLQDDDNYYGKLGQSYLSNSDILELMKNPQKFKMQKNQGKEKRLVLKCFLVDIFIKKF